jgi:hypothetical protein
LQPGRKRHRHEEEFIEAHAGSYGTIQETYKSDAAIQLFQLRCKLHYTMMQTKSYYNALRNLKKNNKESALLPCYRCGQQTKKPSSYELSAYSVLDAVLKGEVWIAQARVVKGFGGPVDAYVLKDNLIIQVDGEQHFKDSMMGNAATQQKAIDEAQNAKAWKQQGDKLKVLRVHYKDSSSFASQLQKSIEECRMWPNHRFIDFTASYWPKATPVFERKGQTPECLIT